MKKKFPVLDVLMAAAVTTGCAQKESGALQENGSQNASLQGESGTAQESREDVIVVMELPRSRRRDLIRHMAGARESMCMSR